MTFGSGIFGSGFFGGTADLADAPDNNYAIDLRIGPHTWAISSADTVAVDATTQVLDGLRTTWGFPDSDPWPSQPQPMSARVGLLAHDVNSFVDLELGMPVMARAVDLVTGSLLAAFYGRLADAQSGPVKRGTQLVTLYDLAAVDFLVDLAETLIDGTWPAESSTARLAHIADAINAVSAIPFTVPAGIPDVDVAALEVKAGKASEVLEDLLKVLATTTPWTRWVLVPVFGPDPVTSAPEPIAFTAAAQVAQETEPGPLPATFVVNAGILELVVDPDRTLDACTVELATTWSKRKKRGTNQVTVAGDFGTVLVANPGPPVRTSIDTDLTNRRDALVVGAMYLPELDTSNGWECDRFTWRVDPDDQALLERMVPDPIDPDPPPCYRMPVTVYPIPDAINPANDLGIYAGQVGRLDLTISRRRIVAAFQLRRRIPRSYDDGTATAASWEWARATFPALVPADVDPALTFYDARLARRP